MFLVSLISYFVLKHTVVSSSKVLLCVGHILRASRALIRLTKQLTCYTVQDPSWTNSRSAGQQICRCFCVCLRVLIMELLIMQFSSAFYHSVLLRCMQTVVFSTLFWQTVVPCSCINVKDEVCSQYQTSACDFIFMCSDGRLQDSDRLRLIHCIQRLTVGRGLKEEVTLHTAWNRVALKGPLAGAVRVLCHVGKD
jgi:hypothetical protein